MKKNKIVLFLSAILAMAFLGYVFYLTRDIGTTEQRMIQSPYILDVTDKIQTRLFVSEQNLSDADWTSSAWDDSDWNEVKIPQHRIVQEPEFKEGNYAYYRIHVPADTIKSLEHVKDELFLAPQYIHFSRFDIYVNGTFYRSNTPQNYTETLINIPLEYSRDNLIAIKGFVKTGDSGINHRGKILAGKGAALNEVHRKSYKVATVLPLIYILSKGSVYFVFFLIFLVMQVERYFDKFLLYGFFVIAEDILIGDYVTYVLNLNQQVYVFNIVNLGILLFLSLFLADILNNNYSTKGLISVFGSLALVTFGISIDFLNFSYVFNITHLLMAWNIAMLGVLIFFSPQVYKLDKSLFMFLFSGIILIGWSTFFSANIGFNLKLLANLLIFFMAAYQTFIHFRREQVLLQEKQLQLLEQEKDVAIGRTAALLAHDVRKPLEHMSYILNQLAGGNNSKEFIDVARKDVDSSLSNVKAQISDIMNYSRIQELKLEPISFYRILASSIKQVMVVNQNLDLKLQYDFQCGEKVMGDESRLSSALTNLISNSVEAVRDIGQKNSGEIRFSTKTEDGMFVFTIFNDGPPIPDHVLPEIFKPLFTFGKNQGTGLGLASVMKIVRDHHGEISVRNVAQQGVEFKLLFKLASVADTIPEAEFMPKLQDYKTGISNPTKGTEGRSLRIFLLDDDIQVYEYLKHITRNLNFNVELDFATDWESGEELISRKRFDLYLLDYDIGSQLTGVDFYQKHLSFLTDEVVVHSNREADQIQKLPIRYQAKPISEDALGKLCEEIYQKRFRLLVVDDSELTLMAWKIYHGEHNILSANTPEDALKLIQADKSIEAAVVDFYFDNSKMNGLELADTIKELRPDLKILISSNADVDSDKFSVIPKNKFEIRAL